MKSNTNNTNQQDVINELCANLESVRQNNDHMTVVDLCSEDLHSPTRFGAEMRNPSPHFLFYFFRSVQPWYHNPDPVPHTDLNPGNGKFNTAEVY